MFENLNKSIEASFNELGECARFMDLSEFIQPRLGKVIDRTAVSWGTDLQRKLDTFLKLNPPQNVVICNSLFVVLHATFESFVRQLIEEAARILDAKAQKRSQMDERIIKNQMAHGGRILSSVYQPNDYLTIDFNDLCKTIGTMHSDSEKVKLDPVIFSFNAGSMSVENISRLFDRIQVSINWDDFGKDTILIQLLDTNGTRDVTKEVKDFVESMVKDRNVIAHTEPIVTRIDSALLEKRNQFIVAFLKRLTGILIKRLK